MATKHDDMQALYDQNLAAVKSSVAAFENNDLAAFFSNVSDSVKWHSPAYGDTIMTKAHWMELLKGLEGNWSKWHLSNALFLPGIDSTSHAMDGSVRFYGRWDGEHKASGMATKLEFYGAYEFNKDHKVKEAFEYADVGGLMNAV
jgi:hypothetical protein